jgi:hypothetical protein
MLEEKQRCWRLCYANEFHLDITPSIRNPGCGNGGELVPDRALAAWKPTNPKGYAARFEQHAALRPRLTLREAAIAAKRADVEDFPEQEMRKRLPGVTGLSDFIAARFDEAPEHVAE